MSAGPRECAYEGDVGEHGAYIDLLAIGTHSIGGDGKVPMERTITMRCMMDTGGDVSCIDRALADSLELGGRLPDKLDIMGHTLEIEKCDLLLGLRTRDAVVWRRAPVFVIPNNHNEFVLGMPELLVGAFEIQGPKKRWRWTIHDTDRWQSLPS